ncbi:MAG: response regulator, partial [Actinomycetota bacterium]|nr:response regulator [Actinomycetota bacterium]
MKEQPSPDPRPMDPPETAAPDAKEILVVDDDAGIGRALVEVLRDEGYRVTLAENGHRALQILALRRDDPPSLILLDLMMPVMDGGAFVAELRKVDRWRDIPVIVVTAKDVTREERQRLNG